MESQVPYVVKMISVKYRAVKEGKLPERTKQTVTDPTSVQTRWARGGLAMTDRGCSGGTEDFYANVKQQPSSVNGEF